MKHFTLTAFIWCFIANSSIAQISVHDGAGTDPDNSAMLDVQAVGKGLLAPRMTFLERPVAPATGLLIYQTDNTPGYYYFNGSDWVRLFEGSNTNVVNVTASNGLSSSGGSTPDITLGGSLTGNTTIAQGGNELSFTGTSSNAFSIDGTTFNVDAANDRVGVGTAPQNTGLNVSGSGTIGGAGDLANSWLLVGTPSSGIGLDNNELTRSGSDLYISANSGFIRFRTNSGSTRMEISQGGDIQVNSLSGSGNRVVVANATGVLSAIDLDGSGIGDDLGDHTADQNLNMSGNQILEVNRITSQDAVMPRMVLNSVSTGDNWTSQGAYISLGESGDLGAAALHMTYRGDGFGFIGSGAVSNAVPGASYFRFDYDSDNIYTPDNLDVDAQIRFNSGFADGNIDMNDNQIVDIDNLEFNSGALLQIDGDRNIELDDANPVWYGNTYGGVIRFHGDGSLAGSKLEAGGLQLERDIQIKGGSPAAGKVLVSDANGFGSWQDIGTAGIGDNLGNHIATTNLNMNNREVDNINYLDMRAGNGYGLRFWSSDSYKISMGNAAEYKYGPVTDYSIKMNMNNSTIRGWTWGVSGSVPVAGLNTQGHLQIAGNMTAIGDFYGRAVNGQYSNIYRMGGIYFTWDSDSYGTNTHHSIRSTYGDSYGDHITVNSFGNIRFNIDANNNGTNYFEIGNATTGTGNIRVRIDELGSATFADDIYLRDGSATSGDYLVRIFDSSDDGIIDVYENGSMQHRIHGNGESIFNEQAMDRDVRFETVSYSDGVRVDAGQNRLEIIASGPWGYCNSCWAGTSCYWCGETYYTRLYTTGAIVAGEYFTTSDQRLKKNIATIANPLDIVKQLRGVTYNRKFNLSESDDPEVVAQPERLRSQLGFIAQEVQEVLPQLVQEVEASEKDEVEGSATPEKVLAVRYSAMVPLLVEAIKEQQEIIESMQARLDELEN